MSANHRLRTIRIANTDRSIIAHATSCLDTVGITFNLYWSTNQKNPTHKPVCSIVVLGRRNVVLWCRYINSASETKRAKLRMMRLSYHASARRRRYRYHRRKSVIFRNTVTRLYVAGATMNDIRRRLACDRETIAQILREESVPIRVYTMQEVGAMRGKNKLQV